MKKNIIMILAILLKLILVFSIIKFGLSYYENKNTFYNQNIVVWIFTYIPLFMGIEAIINVLLSKSKNKK